MSQGTTVKISALHTDSSLTPSPRAHRVSFTARTVGIAPLRSARWPLCYCVRTTGRSAVSRRSSNATGWHSVTNSPIVAAMCRVTEPRNALRCSHSFWTVCFSCNSTLPPRSSSTSVCCLPCTITCSRASLARSWATASENGPSCA